MLVLAVILALVLTPIVRLVLATPIVEYLFLIRIFLDSLPQIYLWIAGILLFLWIAFRSVGRLLIRTSAEAMHHRQYQNRVDQWNHWLTLQRKGKYSRWLLMNRLSKLAIQIIAHTQRESQKKLRQSLLSNESDLPQSIQSYLRQGIRPLAVDTKQKRTIRFRRLEMDVWRIEPETIVRYLESLLEAKHDE